MNAAQELQQRRHALSLVLVVLVAASCTTAETSPTGDLPDSTTQVISTSSQPEVEVLDWLAVAGPDSVYSLAAPLEGTLDIDIDRRCVTVERDFDNRHSSIPVIFVHGTYLVGGDDPHLVSPDGLQLRSGDKVLMGGGGTHASDLAEIDADNDPHDLSDVIVPDKRCWDRDTEEIPGIWIAGFDDPIVVTLDWLPVAGHNLAAGPDAAPSMDGVLEGTLNIDVDLECVTVDREINNVHRSTPVIFIDGSYLVAGSDPAIVPVGAPYGLHLRSGDEVQITGGSINATDLAEIDDENHYLAGVVVPERCLGLDGQDTHEAWVAGFNNPFDDPIAVNNTDGN